uniref:heme attachment to plastid cytochrome c n=1 Tax=Hypnea pseudomusciformis TaxID=1545697 RepID=UPI0027DA7C58|nr:heme attachment to plastid cytochrome c [Hypnea pseudomusciformis]WCH55090.1 heme attachment to plastid cytochrome c [Hypnea pseudomusciformis]WCH56683.1 heme attachment to plastid cytochrome c [Hypnea pseudomusciformis]
MYIEHIKSLQIFRRKNMSWNLIENNLINSAFAILLITLIIYWSNITTNNNKILSKLGTIFTIIINLCLGISLLIRWIRNGYFPLSNLYESLIFLSWVLTFIHLIIEKQNNSKLIGAINIPISLFTIAFSSLVLPPEIKQASPLVPALRSNWLMMHVSIMMFSYGTLILGSLLSILFLIISITNKYKLNKTKLVYDKNKTYLLFNRLNFLQSVDNLSYRIISLGFPMLTIGIIAGSVWANEAWGSYWSWDPKETWALITWIIFATYLHARLSKSWQGEKPAILASLGFIVIWICYLGVNFLGKGLHSYGWI